MLLPKTVRNLLLLPLLLSTLSAQQDVAMSESSLVYTKICALCHGVKAEGNPNIPDSPPLNKLTQDELATKLSEIKGVGFEYYHAKMEKNLKIIELRGMRYDTHEMAKYIYKNFNKESE